MNQSEKKYAINRIQNIANAKKAEAKVKFTTPAKELTDKQKYDLVISGKVKALPFKKQSSYRGDITYDFSKHEADEKFDNEGYDKVRTNIDALTTEIIDKLMFGTEAKEALAMFKQIEN